MKSTRCRISLPFIPRCNFSVRLTLLTLATLGAVTIATPAQETSRKTEQKPATAFQFSTLPALSLGLYDGEMTFRELLKHGDFGIGTFDALDGELIISKGKAWRVSADGKVFAVENKATTPFSVVTYFKPEQTQKVGQPLDYAALQRCIQPMLPTSNVAYAIEISGTFSRIKVRSVPKQSKPYRPLAEVVKTQSVFEWKNVRGTLVGFRFPAYLSGVNLADTHFHFISDDKKQGGHLMDCELQNGQISVQTLRGFEMQLPTAGGSFDSANLATDQSADLKAAEHGDGK